MPVSYTHLDVYKRQLVRFAKALEAASIKTIEDGIMTKSLAALSTIENKKLVNAEELLLAIRDRIDF